VNVGWEERPAVGTLQPTLSWAQYAHRNEVDDGRVQRALDLLIIDIIVQGRRRQIVHVRVVDHLTLVVDDQSAFKEAHHIDERAQ
jgi:hypothetical protein